jgi:hypothetical protein
MVLTSVDENRLRNRLSSGEVVARRASPEIACATALYALGGGTFMCPATLWVDLGGLAAVLAAAVLTQVNDLCRPAARHGHLPASLRKG